jgi:hypothetical protein
MSPTALMTPAPARRARHVRPAPPLPVHRPHRARSSVGACPVQVPGDGTYLARMNLAGQKGTHPSGDLARVTGHRVDGGEVVRL